MINFRALNISIFTSCWPCPAGCDGRTGDGGLVIAVGYNTLWDHEVDESDQDLMRPGGKTIANQL